MIVTVLQCHDDDDDQGLCESVKQYTMTVMCTATFLCDIVCLYLCQCCWCRCRLSFLLLAASGAAAGGGLLLSDRNRRTAGTFLTPGSGSTDRYRLSSDCNRDLRRHLQPSNTHLITALFLGR